MRCFQRVPLATLRAIEDFIVSRCVEIEPRSALPKISPDLRAMTCRTHAHTRRYAVVGILERPKETLEVCDARRRTHTAYTAPSQAPSVHTVIIRSAPCVAQVMRCRLPMVAAARLVPADSLPVILPGESLGGSSHQRADLPPLPQNTTSLQRWESPLPLPSFPRVGSKPSVSPLLRRGTAIERRLYRLAHEILTSDVQCCRAVAKAKPAPRPGDPLAPPPPPNLRKARAQRLSPADAPASWPFLHEHLPAQHMGIGKTLFAYYNVLSLAALLGRDVLPSATHRALPHAPRTFPSVHCWSRSTVCVWHRWSPLPLPHLPHRWSPRASPTRRRQTAAPPQPPCCASCGTARSSLALSPHAIGSPRRLDSNARAAGTYQRARTALRATASCRASGPSPRR